jgi:hypothetical protein
MDASRERIGVADRAGGGPFREGLRSRARDRRCRNADRNKPRQ